ncbi:MAG: ABC transporter substrate-binding protein [Clostridia bacterium]|nr:ABC transporter substrate-binding protein [Clostridia bacterium]
MKRGLLVVLSCLALAALMVAPAIAAEKVVAYTTLDEPLAREAFAAFEKDTGIKVEWVRLTTGEAVARMEAESGNPQASIWYGGVGLGHIEAKNKGLTTPYKSAAANHIPKQFRDKDNYWIGIYAGPLSFASNIQRLKELKVEAPTSWADLLKPQFKNQIQMANPGTSGTAYNMLATIVQLWGEEKAFQYLKALDKNMSQYTKSGSAPGKSAALGECAVAIGYAHDQVKLISQGYPITITFASEGTGFEVASISLVKGGKQPENAKKLYDWGLGARAAEIYAKMGVVPFVKVQLMPGAIPIDQVNTIDQDDVWAASQKERLVERWNNEIYSSR